MLYLHKKSEWQYFKWQLAPLAFAGLCFLMNRAACQPVGSRGPQGRTPRGHGSAACCVEAEARLHPVLRAEAHEMISHPSCPLRMLTSEESTHRPATATRRGSCGDSTSPGGPAQVQMSQRLTDCYIRHFWDMVLRPLPRTKEFEFLGMWPEYMHLKFFSCSWILTNIESELKKNESARRVGAVVWISVSP